MRHRIALGLLLLAILALGWGCRGRTVGAASERRLIILGFDGMDYELTRKLMDEGRLPGFRRLAQQGSFSPLATSVPPQSPVAWSNFITGLDSGTHGIYDFIHRDPGTMVPYLSTSVTEDGRSIEIGKWKLPITGGQVKLLRKGRAFWETLEESGIETTIIRMPANFPPSGTATRELSGMGTPDVLGTYGTFSFYTSELFASDRQVSGGAIYEVDYYDYVVNARLYGPPNPFLVEEEQLTADFTVHVDPEEPLAKIVVGDEERILKVGEWSDWVPVSFAMVPTQSLPAMGRFYLKSVRPEFGLYVSPLNFDPLAPALPISTPSEYAAELARASGRFYTQGMPEDTKGLTEGVLDRKEFLAQARIAGEELIRQYEPVLEEFRSGVLFYYFGNIDQVSHMMWRSMDPDHPAYDPERDPEFANVVPELYQRMDEIVGLTLDRMGENTTLIVMSDHGFASWRRSFHLNTWLKEQGYLAVRDPDLKDDPGFFVNVDWAQTRAYGLGLNGLYINVSGREKTGIVLPTVRDELMREIAEKLLAVVDPATGEPAITKVYLREETYADGGELEIGPDIIVGYAKGTRCSNESAMGGVSPEVFSDNLEEWSGDHAMDHETVPGILLTSRRLARPASRLTELTEAVLAEMGAETRTTSR